MRKATDINGAPLGVGDICSRREKRCIIRTIAFFPYGIGLLVRVDDDFGRDDDADKWKWSAWVQCSDLTLVQPAPVAPAEAGGK